MNFIARMPQSAKIALAAALVVGALAGWYFGFVRPNQAAQQAVTAPNTPATPVPESGTQTARPLEVLPLPFLVTEAPKDNPKPEQGSSPATAITSKPKVTVPPNPFVPLIVETPNQPAPAVVAQATPPATSRPSLTARPIPTQSQPISVQQPRVPLPQTNLPATRPTPPTQPSLASTPGQARISPSVGETNLPGSLSLGSGALPIRLSPLSRELTAPNPQDQTAAAIDPNVGTTANLDYAKAELDARVNQVLQPTTTTKSQGSLASSGLGQYVREQGLKLSGVVLGATSVGIFQSKDGFVVLPVGRTLPGSEILLKSLNTNEALLVRGSETLNLQIEDKTP
ncbi:MAG: hypothetical protein C4331_11285 [Meiothermus sp.]